MVIIGVVASVIVAFGTIAAGTRVLVTYIYNCGREREREDAERVKQATEIRVLKQRRIEG
jgi:hypothetical protein